MQGAKGILSRAGLVLALVAAAAPARADDNTDCAGSSAQGERRIAACTRLIDGGTLMGTALATAYFNRGVARADANDLNGAIDDYTAAIEIKADHGDAFYARGNAYLQKTDYKKAIADYDAAIKLKPNFADAYNNRAWSWFQSGEPAKGLPDADRAVELNPRDPNILDTRAQILKALGRKEEAIRDFKAALALNPDDTLKKSILDALRELGAEP
jgi:tetratricopeptide (TPR) repeat protein